MKIAFVTDSGSGISPEFWKENGIYSLPLQLSSGAETFQENETISHEDVISRLKNDEVLKTSMPAYGRIQDLFDTLKAQGYEGVFAVPICKGLSGTLDAMESCANQAGLVFYGFDCYSTAVLQAHCILEAKKMYEAGDSIETILAKLEKIAKSADTILLCSDLQHMKRGGRLTPMAAALGGLLKIKPILHDNIETDGKVDVLDKVRTMSRAQDRVIDRLKKIGVTSEYDITVAHVDALEEAEAYAKKISAALGGAKIRIIDLVSAVSAHTGLGCLAVQVFDAQNEPVTVYDKQTQMTIGE
ncbi:DegV family protein [Ileibacterium valens]|uniref:DegV family protein n=1 Tax=Ileibacterium valens TaxID=1862668 RepID=UPI00272A3CCC|nr:DegV family protein [Ileibacterium valens]